MSLGPLRQHALVRRPDGGLRLAPLGADAASDADHPPDPRRVLAARAAAGLRDGRRALRLFLAAAAGPGPLPPPPVRRAVRALGQELLRALLLPRCEVGGGLAFRAAAADNAGWVRALLDTHFLGEARALTALAAAAFAAAPASRAFPFPVRLAAGAPPAASALVPGLLLHGEAAPPPPAAAGALAVLALDVDVRGGDDDDGPWTGAPVAGYAVASGAALLGVLRREGERVREVLGALAAAGVTVAVSAAPASPELAQAAAALGVGLLHSVPADEVAALAAGLGLRPVRTVADTAGAARPARVATLALRGGGRLFRVEAVDNANDAHPFPPGLRWTAVVRAPTVHRCQDLQAALLRGWAYLRQAVAADADAADDAKLELVPGGGAVELACVGALDAAREALRGPAGPGEGGEAPYGALRRLQDAHGVDGAALAGCLELLRAGVLAVPAALLRPGAASVAARDRRWLAEAAAAAATREGRGAGAALGFVFRPNEEEEDGEDGEDGEDEAGVPASVREALAGGVMRMGRPAAHGVVESAHAKRMLLANCVTALQQVLAIDGCIATRPRPGDQPRAAVR